MFSPWRPLTILLILSSQRSLPWSIPTSNKIRPTLSLLFSFITPYIFLHSPVRLYLHFYLSVTCLISIFYLACKLQEAPCLVQMSTGYSFPSWGLKHKKPRILGDWINTIDLEVGLCTKQYILETLVWFCHVFFSMFHLLLRSKSQYLSMAY